MRLFYPAVRLRHWLMEMCTQYRIAARYLKNRELKLVQDPSVTNFVITLIRDRSGRAVESRETFFVFLFFHAVMHLYLEPIAIRFDTSYPRSMCSLRSSASVSYWHISASVFDLTNEKTTK
jgi:hypothetical protein